MDAKSFDLDGPRMLKFSTWIFWNIVTSGGHASGRLNATFFDSDGPRMLKSSIWMFFGPKKFKSQVLTSSAICLVAWMLKASIWMALGCKKLPSFAVGVVSCVSVWTVRRVAVWSVRSP